MMHSVISMGELSEGILGCVHEAGYRPTEFKRGKNMENIFSVQR